MEIFHMVQGDMVQQITVCQMYGIPIINPFSTLQQWINLADDNVILAIRNKQTVKWYCLFIIFSSKNELKNSLLDYNIYV